MALGTTQVRIGWPYDPGVKPVPAGWTPDAIFDNRYLQGDDNTFLGTSNGGGAHNHTQIANHTHVGDLHTHTFSGPSTPTTQTTVNGGFVNILSRATHGHNSETSNPTAITYANVAITINNTDMHPPWLAAMILKPDDIGQTIPVDAVCFGDSATPPDTFAKVGVAWNGRFVVGAAVGGGMGGNATHIHTSPNHTHAAIDHGHAAKLCGTSTSTASIGAQGVTSIQTSGSRHHNVTLLNRTLLDVSNKQVVVQTASSEPAHIKLLGIKRTSVPDTNIPRGVIVPFVGAVNELPADWVLCDGAGTTLDCTDRQVKITTTEGEIGDTAGSDTHGHTVDDHKHTHAFTHAHEYSQTTIAVDWQRDRVAVINSSMGHAHSWSIGLTRATMQDAAVSLSTDDGRFDYRRVIWVKYAPADVTVKLLGGKVLGGKIAAA